MLNSQKTVEKTSENRKLNEEMSVEGMIQFDSKEENLHYPGVYDIDPKELSKKLNDVCLIDVRQPEEFTGELGHIPKAKLLVLDELPEKMSEIPKDRTVVFVCRSGGRSARATSLALQHGFSNVYNLKGGMLLWNDLHLPTEM